MAQEIPSQYDPTTVEDRWNQVWEDAKAFRSVPDDREPYTVVIPPPNVTGVLHMGHMLNNTIQDVLVRRARMQGRNACWVPGTDHASIATEAKVVRKLRDQGIKKSDLSRDAFLEHAWDWTREHGGIILKQLRKLGASCDWDRTSFTLDEQYSRSVIDTFLDLHAKGHIYRGLRMVNWDPQALTAVSDEEVIHTEEQSKLHHVRYRVEGTEDWLTIATTRPETILADTAICIHPEDERYTHLHGTRAIVPVAGRSIPIILDEYVDREFGTGCLKVTPAHDPNDHELGQKHSLEIIDMLNPDGTVNAVGGEFEGRLGTGWFVVFLLVTATISNLAQYGISLPPLFQHGPTFGGMSGVVYGLAGHAWIRGRQDPRSGIELDESTFTFLMIWFFLCFLPFMPIANTAHTFGLLVGLAWGWIATRRAR